MKTYRNLAVTIIFLFSVLYSGCERNCMNENDDNENLIKNSSFETNGQSSFDGWKGIEYAFVEDVPSDGGKWALQVSPGWIPEEGFAETAITDLSGLQTFEFSCETKAINWTGHITMLKKKGDGSTYELAKITFDNAEWKPLSLTFNSTFEKTDLLIIHLSAGVTEVAYGRVLFDNITLKAEN